ncbi:hypothetical protein [Flavobacterium subsaxonicum]|uniref:Barstar (barnase inhibitor) domain-containing protein n=1 Tax=Flavobacterium subsaxonicum WB 4.1-42 = DSM 21790 TaxID=1121898 RepID=A0A0A2MJC0_9FLAO|nr:hypothetical protein [Flavobacterium subsaxonicum]KGO91651.1 hypothetical protein Q766_16600 [Flavobacterium subsaxonicum WB 4.1-42 = DSM 21790]
MKIIAYYNGVELGSCNYTWLDSTAYKSARSFTFKDFIITNPAVIDNSGHSFINISVYITNVYGLVIELNKIKIVPLVDTDFTKNGNIEVYGTILPDWFVDVYDQAIIDVFYFWDHGTVPDFPAVPLSLYKESGLQARGIFSGLPKQLRSGEIVINAATIIDEFDFYEALAVNLVSEKGFMGGCYNSLADCLIESYDKDYSAKLIFKNGKQLNNVLGADFLDDIITLFGQYNITLHLL